MEITLLIYVEEEYGKRLLRFLLGKRHPKLHPELITRYEMIKKRLEKEEEGLIVLTDDRNVYEEDVGKVILLGERQSKKERKIFQYQEAEKIYDELLGQIELEDMTGWEEMMVQEEEKGCYCLCSANRQKNMVMAGILSQYLAGKGKTLYLSLGEFPYYYDEMIQGKADFSRKGMGELIFLTDREKFKEREDRCRGKFGRANLLAPIPYYRDLLDCTAKDWQEIFRRLQEECDYDYLVVQMDELMECSMDVMAGCERVWFLYDDNALGERERDVFSHYCQMEKRENLLEKICWVEMPVAIHEWKERLERGELAEIADDEPLMSYMKQFLRGVREDACFVEDIG